MPDIDNLSIKIGASARDAEGSLNRLIATLQYLRAILRATEARDFVNTLQQVRRNASSAATAINRMAAAQERLNRAMGGFEGAALVSTMRNASNSASNAADSFERFSNALTVVNNAMQRMRSSNGWFGRGVAPMLNGGTPLLTGATQEPIYTEFVDEDSVSSGLEHVERAARGASIRIRGVLSGLAAFGKTAGGVLANGLKGAATSVGGFVASIARIAKYRAIRAFLKDMGQSFKDLYGYSKEFGTEFATSMDKITTSTTYLRNSIAAMFAPLINAVAPVLDFLIDKVVEALNWVNQLFSVLSGKTTYTAAKKVTVTWEDTFTSVGNKAKNTAKEIRRTLLGFDEINRLDKAMNSSSGGGGSSPYSNNYQNMFEERPVSGGFISFSDAVEKSLSNTLSRIALIVSGAVLAVGAVLTFSGANIPLGLSMIAAGAAGLVSVVGVNWDGLSKEVKHTIAKIEAVVGAGLLGIGAILAFSGANVPLGIGMMIAGVGTVASAIAIDWDFIQGKLDGSLRNIVSAISLAMLPIGAVLAFSGVSVPIGLALMAAGIAGTFISEDWNNMPDKIQGVIHAVSKILNTIGVSALAIGAILAFSGVATPLGITLMGVGVASLVAGVATNWDAVFDNVKSVIDKIKNFLAPVGGAAIALGVILLAAGLIPLGLPLLAVGIASTIAAIPANWDALVEFGKTAFGKVKQGWDFVAAVGLEVWAKMKSTAAELWSWLKGGWEKLGEIALNVGLVIATSAVALWGTVKRSWASLMKGKDKVLGLVAELKNTASDWWDNAKGWWSEHIEGKSLAEIVAPLADTAKDWWSNAQTWWSEAIKGKWLSDVYTKLYNGAAGWWYSAATWWNQAKGWLSELYVSVANTMGYWWNQVVGWWNQAKGWLSVDLFINPQEPTSTGRFSSGGSKVTGGGGSTRGGGAIGYIGRSIGGILADGLNAWRNIPAYAGGTWRAHGSLFLAGEAGPEIVGHLGGRTEVLNKSQLAMTMFEAVHSAMTGISFDLNAGNDGYGDAPDALFDTIMMAVQTAIANNPIDRERNDILRRLEDKELTAEVTAADIARAQQRYNRRAGTTVSPVGT